jgi:chromosomal replication initiator protein
VRRLEGALMRVASFASLSGKELTNEVVEHLLKDILNEEARHAVTIEQIQRKVAEHFDVRIADMTSKRRPANIAFPRQIAMYLARELTKASLNEIGDAFGGRDHGTVPARVQAREEADARAGQHPPDDHVHRQRAAALTPVVCTNVLPRAQRGDCGCRTKT